MFFPAIIIFEGTYVKFVDKGYLSAFKYRNITPTKKPKMFETCSADATYDELRELEIGSIAYLSCPFTTPYPAWSGPPITEGISTSYTYGGSESFNPNLSSDKLSRLSWASSNTLAITYLQVHDDGVYACSAFGMGTHKIRLVVWGKYCFFYHYASSI